MSIPIGDALVKGLSQLDRDYRAMMAGKVGQDINVLKREMEMANRRGVKVSPGWLVQQSAYRQLKRDVEYHMSQTAQGVGQGVSEANLVAIVAGNKFAGDAISNRLGPHPSGLPISWAGTPSPQTVTRLAAVVVAKQSPLQPVLDRVGGASVEKVRRSLINSMILGVNPVTAADRVAKELEGMRYDLERIYRTEYMRAYRSASLENYRGNSDVVEGWIWSAACDELTCASCWAMDGTEHDLAEPLDDHVNGRCAPIPMTKGWGEILGDDSIVDTAEPYATGEEKFAELGADEQRAILGPAGYDLFKGGVVSLSDFSTRSWNPVWGTQRTQTPVWALKALAAGKGWKG